jgi:hypothetical protein
MRSNLPSSAVNAVKFLSACSVALALMVVAPALAQEANLPRGGGMVVPDPSLDAAQTATGESLSNWTRTYFIWTQGRFSFPLDIGLDPARRYLITGALTGRSGSDYGQIYISTICFRRSIDQILCEVEDEASPRSNIMRLGINRIIANATRVTVKLSANGGLNRAEGTIYDITAE